MRSLMIRFKDCEGPGVLEHVLREKGYRVSYHNAYDEKLQLHPSAHLNFDLIVLLGGSQTVADDSNDSFFAPYYELVESVLVTPGRKLIGICLGSQIIARVLGGKVIVGDKGPEVGFAPVKIKNKSNRIFAGIDSSEIQAFHLHEDVFAIPEGADHLLEGGFYPNQMFSYKDKAFAFQTHIEPTLPMLRVWQDVHKEFIAKGAGDFSKLAEDQKTMESSAKIVFRNILNI
ncbi:type 1 glutamine amidotransferase [Leptospira ilyithenensis]|uniref:Type 1 glutamine amidotransferase n=1 Tax=Leptospira ilyithenensis TaxID=2484901 RepID=A0A4R9LWC0_9LEPT|nr:type 1 glutamine amidotransferase [Leptospira ilyithenensis]TGN14340.1 type 1 glutamine amidotransferase [Leptospira ilyithenensis]